MLAGKKRIKRRKEIVSESKKTMTLTDTFSSVLQGVHKYCAARYKSTSFKKACLVFLAFAIYPK